MTKRLTVIALLVAFISVDAFAQNRTHRRRGVILGGLAGAAIGAAIGDKGDNETAGALIGGAVGAVAGGTIGNQKDQRIEHNYRYHSRHRHYTPSQAQYPQGQYPQYHQPYYNPQHATAYPRPAAAVAPAVPATTTSVPAPVAPEDVVAMMKSGLSESVIIQQIQINGAARALTVGEIIQLHRIGVSEPILTALQTNPIVTNPQVNLELPPPPPQPALGPSVEKLELPPTRLQPAPSILAPSNSK